MLFGKTEKKLTKHSQCEEEAKVRSMGKNKEEWIKIESKNNLLGYVYRFCCFCF